MKKLVFSLCRVALVEKIGTNCKGRRRRDNRSDNTKGLHKGAPRHSLAEAWLWHSKFLAEAWLWHSKFLEKDGVDGSGLPNNTSDITI